MSAGNEDWYRFSGDRKYLGISCICAVKQYVKIQPKLAGSISDLDTGGSETSDHGDQFGAIAPDPTADEVKRLTLELRTATGKVRLKQQHIIEQDAQRKRTEMLLDQKSVQS